MLTTLAVFKDEMEISGTTRDSFITRLIGHASAAIENYCDRSFTRARSTSVVSLPLNLAAATRLLLPRLPLITVYSVTLEATGVAIDAGTYSIDDAAAGILFRARGWSPWSVDQFPNASTVLNMPLREVRYLVDFEAGYDAAEGSPGSPASPVPPDLERATLDLVKQYYLAVKRDPSVRSEDVAGVGRTDYWVGSLPSTQNSGMPVSITGVLDNYRKIMVA